jgi:tetratricopeptide (TPR) repeat protein
MAFTASAFTERFRAALAHLNAGEVKAAAAQCDALRQSAPDDPAVLQLHATVALRDGRPNDALASIRRSLDIRPGHVPSLILAARAARAAGAVDQAVRPLEEAVARATHAAEPAFLLCLTLLELGHQAFDAALANTLSRFAAHAKEWQELGLALQRAGRPADALAAYTRATAADPALAQAHFGRGLVLRDAGRYHEAHAALRRAAALDPTASGVWFAMGLTCQDLLDEPGAATAFAAALRERPAFAEAAVNLGIARQRLGDMPAAIAAYREAIRSRPDTFGRIAQAMTAAGTGMLCLDVRALRRLLGA